MAHYSGHVYIKSVNLSHNKANSCSAIRCYPNKINEETKHGSDVLFCSFSNNTATSQHCILFDDHESANNHEIKNCNIVENNSPKTFFSRGETNIYQCSFLNNGDPCFCTEGANSKITINSCYTDSFQEDISISYIQSEKTHPFIVALTFYETGECHNLFVQFYPTIKCGTCEHRNLFLHKILLKCLYIFQLS